MVSRTLDVAEFIDSRPLSRVQKVLFILCFCLVFLDGFTAQTIGYVAPVLIRAWHVSASRFGLVVSTGLVGLMLGALLIAPLADRYGRRPVLLASASLFGLFSLLVLAASSLGSLTVLLFLIGLGLGGSMPNAIALTSEYAPRRSHGMIVMMMFSGFTAGSLVAGLTAANIIAQYGWQSVFAIGGTLALLSVPVLYQALLESPRFLLLKRHDAKSVAEVLRRIDPSVTIDDDPIFQLRAEPIVRASVSTLFEGEWRKKTILLWIIFFMSLLDIYLLVSWLPTVISSSGAKIRTSIIVGSLLQGGGLAGTFALSWLLDRTSSRLTLFPAYLLAAACIGCIGFFASNSIALTMLVVFFTGFGVIGGQTAANATAAASYPTRVRSTGVGYALGIGRIGSIVGPVFAGELIGRHTSLRELFVIGAIPALCAALAAAGLSVRPEAAMPQAENGS